MPHLCQFVHVRRVLVNPAALGTSATGLLDNNRVVVHLYRFGAILAANDRTRDTLLCGNGLSDRGGFLDARWSTDNALLKKLLARTLPPYGGERTMAYQFGRISSFVIIGTIVVVLFGCGGGGGNGMDDAMMTGGDSTTGDGDPMTDDGDSMTGVNLLTPEEAKSSVVELQLDADTFLLSPYYSDDARFDVISCQGRSCTFSIEGQQVATYLDNYEYDPEPDVGSDTYTTDAVMHGIVVGTVSFEFFGTTETGDPYRNYTYGYGGWLDHGYFEVQRIITSTMPESTVSYGPLERLGALFGTGTGSNPVSGSATWRGVMVGADVSHNTFDDDVVRGDTDVRVDLANADVDVTFTNIRYLANDSALGDISWEDIPMVNGRFEKAVDSQPSHLSGTFLGHDHEEVGGVFEHGTLVGAFGAKRQ